MHCDTLILCDSLHVLPMLLLVIFCHKNRITILAAIKPHQDLMQAAWAEWGCAVVDVDAYP